LQVDGHTVSITNPEKVFFAERGYTKMDLVNYYIAVAEGALRGVYKRPMVLKRFVNGAAADPFFQKRAPSNLPDWMYTALITFPSGRSADLVVCEEPADLAWVINTGCIDLNPWPVRVEDVDRPDELRVDLDPTPEATWAVVREVALACNGVLADLGYRGYPKTSGSRGIHINVRIEPKWEFTDVRRAALALAREVERRVPEIATTKWWKEERHGVFIDYNQNARDRTVASAYSVRPTPDARVSCPMEWSEVPTCEMEAFTIETVPRRFKEIGDPSEGIDDVHHSLEPLLELAERQKVEGLGEAPYPPHFPKTADEPRRVQPSRARKEGEPRPFSPSRNRWGRQRHGG
jgi:DNA ligase D-like protein (predicted polymerase)